MREFLKGLDLDSELIDTIMAEHGKLVTKDKEALQSLQSQVNQLQEDSKNAAEIKEKYEALEAAEAQRNAEKEKNNVLSTVKSFMGDKKFVNEFTQNAIVDELTQALNNDANKGKSTKDLFDEITNGKDGLFINPNQIVDMPSIDESVETSVSKDAFDKMGYNERLKLKQSNPELFKKYNV